MAFPREPDELYRSPQSDEEIRRQAAANAGPRPSRSNDESQPDLEMTEGPASSGRIAAYAIAALLIVGAVIYGMSHTSTNNVSNAPSPQKNTATNTPATTPPPPVRNVTPDVNPQPGTTTGMAPPAAPQNNPATAPSDSGPTTR